MLHIAAALFFTLLLLGLVRLLEFLVRTRWTEIADALAARQVEGRPVRTLPARPRPAAA